MAAALSERRKALFEPLEPVINVNGKRPSAESLLPPPDFDAASYPRGWLIGKKRKLVNVDVVESMRRITIEEMNRKDREIDGLNEQFEEVEKRAEAAAREAEACRIAEQEEKLLNVWPESLGYDIALAMKIGQCMEMVGSEFVQKMRLWVCFGEVVKKSEGMCRNL
ncbi:protein HEADING DATE REPRESSOR 1-like [Camellia sinensis]|uniref:protein HEADING DATE REPRESSOR 1-like n=1 Tax=Camellia sinensis TaxID=4442 RepID=UPI001035C920|nr:protein HEADING DATE REPRESSOR 1-like [Camellia sinensis]